MFGIKEAPHYVLTNLLKLSASSFCENLVCLRPLNMTLQINNFEMMVLIHKHIKSFFFIIKDQMTLVAQSAVCFLSPKYCSPDHFSAINQMDCFFLFPLKWLYIMRRWVYKLSSLSFERLKMLVHNKKVVGYRGGWNFCRKWKFHLKERKTQGGCTSIFYGPVFMVSSFIYK